MEFGRRVRESMKKGLANKEEIGKMAKEKVQEECQYAMEVQHKKMEEAKENIE